MDVHTSIFYFNTAYLPFAGYRMSSTEGIGLPKA